MGLMAGLTRTGVVLTLQVKPFRGVAGEAIDQRLRLLVRLVAVRAGILHRGIGGPGNSHLSQGLMAIKTTLAQREKLLLFYQVLMTGYAVHRCHAIYLCVFFLMAVVTDRFRGFELMQGNGMTLGAGDVLLLSMLLVTGGSCYLNPPRIITLMTLFAGIVRDYGVLFHTLKVPEGKIKQQPCTGK